MRNFFGTGLKRLAAILDRLHPGRADEIASASLSPIERRDALLSAIDAATGPDGVRSPRREERAAPAPVAAPAAALPTFRPARQPDAETPSFAARPQPIMREEVSPALAIRFEQLMASTDMADRAEATRLYLKDPVAFTLSCQAAERAARARNEQRRKDELAAVHQLRRRDGWE